MRLKQHEQKSFRFDFAKAAVLAAGLAISCHHENPANNAQPFAVSSSSAPTTAVIHNSEDQKALREYLRAFAKDINLKNFDPASIRIVTDSLPVRVGDSVEDSMSNMKTKVTKINELGVEFDSEYFLPYSKPRAIGEFLIVTIIRAEKGAAGSAVISVTHADPQGYTEMKKTIQSKMSP